MIAQVFIAGLGTFHISPVDATTRHKVDMNPDTGAIAQFETQKDARRAGHTMPLTDKQALELRGMNRKARRAWAAKQWQAPKVTR